METFMRRALDLAERGAGFVNPNPLVGAVLIKNNTIIAEAFHERFGGPHAEAQALQLAGAEAAGADLYVNWEPCIAYPGKRTPPCVEKIIASGVARVIVATRDATPAVNGRGIAALRAAGIEVVEDVLKSEARRLNEIRTKFAVTGKPFVLLKMAMTADGKIATQTGDSYWVSSDKSLELAHQLRHRYAAVLVGSGTALSDDPQLTVRKIEGRDPMRIVLDSTGRIPPDSRILHLESDAPTVIATASMSSARENEILQSRSRSPVEVWRLPKDSASRVDLNALMAKLAEREVDSVLVEGGSNVASAFLHARLLDKITFIIAPKLVGGASAKTPIGGEGVELMSEAFPLKDPSAHMLGEDFVYEAYLDYASSEGS